ncbi:MAG: ABC transporter permease [Gemmatimonadota bacterium]
MSRTILLRWGLKDSLRSYWFLANAGLFLAGGVLLTLFGGTDVTVLGYRGFARALAGLAQLALFLVPVMALFPATAAIAGERELGSLDYLLAQPLDRGAVFHGKWSGVNAALLLSLGLAFSVTGLVAALRGVPPGLIASLLGLTCLLATAFASLGLWISAVAPSRTRAISLGLTAWIGLTVLGSLGVLAWLVRWGLPAWALEGWSFVNPVEAYRLAAITLLDADATLLGPVGAALAERFGHVGVIGLAVLSLAGWTGGAYWAGRVSFRG